MRERASGEGVTLSSHLSSKLQSASMPLDLHGNQAAIRPSSIEPGCGLFVCTWNISKWACPNWPAIEGTRARAVDHAKFKTTKIYSQVILVNYTKFAPTKISCYTVTVKVTTTA